MGFRFGVIFGALIGAGAALYLDRHAIIGPLIQENWPIESAYIPDTEADGNAFTLAPWQSTFGPDTLEKLNATACFVRDPALLSTPPSWLERAPLAALSARQTPQFPPPELNDYPGLVKLEIIRSSQGSSREHCAGTRIAENWILTAAHCVVSGPGQVKPNDMIVIYPQTDVRPQTTPITPVKAAFCHGAYNHDSLKFDDDIALLYIEDTASLNGVDIVAIDTPNDNLEQDRFVQTRLAGWGKNGENRFLQGGPVKLTNIGQTLMISENIGPIGPCVGDSGGPLYVSALGAKPIIGGILQSVTLASCASNNNAFYLRIQSYAGWIERLMKSCEQGARLVC